jgi:dUTP pyrophosphatase
MIAKVLNNGIALPKYATPGSAGFDLYNRSGSSLTIEPGCNMLIPTGLYITIPEGCVGFVIPRSGKALNEVGYSLANSPGVIDEDYIAEVGLIACNYGRKPVLLGAAERIAQMVVLPYVRCEFQFVEALVATSREGGFGSTGSS